MNDGLIILRVAFLLEGRDAPHERVAAAAPAAPSQQQLRRSSSIT